MGTLSSIREATRIGWKEPGRRFANNSLNSNNKGSVRNRGLLGRLNLPLVPDKFQEVPSRNSLVPVKAFTRFSHASYGRLQTPESIAASRNSRLNRSIWAELGHQQRSPQKRRDAIMSVEICTPSTIQ
jgi:hypothetical protein